jgi:hypothetical protein
MKRNIDIKSLLLKLLTIGGFLVFLFTLGIGNPLVIITCILLTAVIFFKLKYKKKYLKLLTPLSSGLLFLIMKLFYWDNADFIQRLNLLFLISLVFSMIMAVREFKLLKKFLFFFNRLPLKKRLIAIFVAAEILFIIASFIMVQKGVKWGGDEPHYLVISHSIARDFDLNVFDQYARDRYREFTEVRLKHHARVGKGFKTWYSYGHLPGLSLTLAPFFLFKLPVPLLYSLIRAYLGLFGALLAVVVYLFALKLWHNRSLAVFITAVLAFTAPVFFYSIHIFAELQACLLILSALYLLLYSSREPQRRLEVSSCKKVSHEGHEEHEEHRGRNFFSPKKTLLAGFLLGISVFWGLKYAIFIYLFSAGFFVYFVIKKQPKRAVLFVLFPVLLQMLFFGYLYYAYGNFNPMSIYNGVMTEAQAKEYYSKVQVIPLQKRVETLLGIFFDQRDGLLLYNPFYFLAFPGLIIAFKKFKTYWREILICAAGFAFILFLGYSTVRPGYCPQARYLTPAAWLLMLFAIIYYKETGNKTVKKWTFYLPVYSFLVVIYQVFHPFTLYQSATHLNLERPALMFRQWSNIHFSIPDVLPSFIKVPGNFKYLPNIIFLVMLLGFIVLAINKLKSCRVRFFMPVLFAALFLAAVLFPRVPIYNPILLNKEGAVPCKIYGESPYPTRAAERKFELKGKSVYHYTVSTLKPVPFFVMEFENHGKTGYSVSITNFDEQKGQDRIVPTGPGKTQKIYIRAPRYKKFKVNCFYRFHLEVEPSPPAKPSLYLQLYPVKRRAAAKEREGTRRREEVRSRK